MTLEISGWLNDISATNIYFTFFAQNHVYGCLSLLEQIEEGEIILDCSQNPVIVYKDISGEFQTFSIYDNFHMIGTIFGFSDDLSGVFLGWDEDYRKNWLAIFCKVHDSLESIELAFYNFYKSKFSGKSVFEAVIAGKEITEDMKTVFIENQVKINKNKERHREYTYRAKRNTTPLYRRRGFNKTRKHL